MYTCYRIQSDRYLTGRSSKMCLCLRVLDFVAVRTRDL